MLLLRLMFPLTLSDRVDALHPRHLKKAVALVLTGLFLAALVCLCLSAHTESRNFLQTPPPVVLWAWERPEDLRFIDPTSTAVAYLAATIDLHHGQVIIHPRLQPLLVPNSTQLVAVFRIETSPAANRSAFYRATPLMRSNQEALVGTQLPSVVATITHAASLPRVVGIQIDFDAKLSERPFYRALLFDLRHQLGPTMPISITALASWCFDDDWLASLPINEAVPMLFRMSADANEINVRLASGDFREPLCRTSLGLSTDEHWPAPLPARRLYIFNPRSWSKHDQLAALWETRAWH